MSATYARHLASAGSLTGSSPDSRLRLIRCLAGDA
jgi:hypothetical protein